MLKRLGKNPGGKRLEKIRNSPNFVKGKFLNIEPTSVNPANVSMLRIIREIMNRPNSVRPSGEIPYRKTDLKGLHAEKPTVVWFGHSSYLLKFRNFNILVDPVLSGNASPFRFFGKAFDGTQIYEPEDLPDIDLLLLTHDHYDHLDYRLIKHLRKKTKLVVTSLGVGSHLELWGVKKKKIRELDWGENIQINPDLIISALPARHFSGRSFGRFNTLWSSFVLEWGGYKIYIGGDSGYSNQFEKIGEEYGGFDLAFLECGQYGKYWPQIHMFPEETVKAAIDLNAKILFPVHWAKFVLSTHPWNEPIKRLSAEAKKQGQQFVSPLLGESYEIGDDSEQQEWWNFK